MESLEKTLGYTFADKSLIETALTHSSYANEHHTDSNERLEFLGDSVLGVTVASHLYKNYPELPEGRMTRLRAELVCEESLWTVAEKLGFGEHLRLGKGEAVSGGRKRRSILADCVEAVIAAMYLDGGFEPVSDFINSHILSKLGDDVTAIVRDYKTELQELVQQTPGDSVSYAMVGESGPDHMKVFTAAVYLHDEELGRGEGRTKKEAEQRAACAALGRMQK